MKFSKSITALLLLLAGCLLFASGAAAIPSVTAYDRTLTVGTGSGSSGATVNLPVTIDNNTDVAGASFTLAYDPTVFTFMGLQQGTQTIDDGSGASPDYSSTMFYQYNDQDNADGTAKIGRVMIAAASAQEFSSTTLFKAQFQILGGSGTYPINLYRTAVHNPQAGYSTPTLLPVLVGIPAATANTAGYYSTATYSTRLVNGSITVNAPGYTISGSVTYNGGIAANGSTVKLFKQAAAAGAYLLNGTTTVNNGAYSFSNKAAGTYKLVVQPYNNAYFMASASGIAVSANTTQDFTLETATPLTGTVTVNGGVVAGVKVKVTDSSQNVLGIYPVNSNGYFESLPLPSGSYTLTAIYGNVELGTLNDGNTVNFTETLYSISGELDPDSGTDVPITVQVVSPTTKLLKTVTMNADNTTGDTYTISNLLPGNDYIVSAVTSGSPVLYWNQKTDITEANAVDISSGDVTTADFDFSLLLSQATISGNISGGNSATMPIGVFAFETTTYTVASSFSDPTNSGAYTMSVPPGNYRLFAISNGKAFYYSTSGTVRALSQSSTITLGNTATGGGTIDISEASCQLSGGITKGQTDGDPVAGAVVVAGNTSGQAATVSQQNGSYKITGLSPGTYQVAMNPMQANYALQFKSKTIDTDNCGSATLDFIIDTGNTVSGEVRQIAGLGGATIADAMIYMVNEDTGRLAGGRMYFSGQDGSYTIGDIPDAVYTMVANHPEYKTARYSGLNIITDTTQDIELDKGAFIAGITTDGNGSTPLAGVTIVAIASGATPAYALSDASGNYAIYGLDAGKQYLVIASKRGYERNFSTSQTPSTSGTNIDFIMNPLATTFTLSGDVSDDCGPSPIEGARIIASYSPGAGKPDFIKGGLTDADGDYSISGLPQNKTYTVTMVPPGHTGAIQRTTIDSANTNTDSVTQDFTVLCSSEISGTITVTTATDAVFVVLYDTDTGSVVDFRVLTDSNDYSYTFSGLATTTTYKINAGAAGNVANWYNDQNSFANATAVSPGATNVDITLQAE